MRIAILASGAGSNAANILSHFHGDPRLTVALIASNKEEAGVLDIARQHAIPTYLIRRENFVASDAFLNELKKRKIDLVVLAGFLLKVPPNLVVAFPNKIINIHPALLPRFGGKGMYGHFVHEAVHAAGEKESGITVHYVNENYDEGDILFQARVVLDESDTPATIEKKVRELEMLHYPTVIESLIP